MDFFLAVPAASFPASTRSTLCGPPTAEHAVVQIDVDLFETMADRGLHYGYAITEGEVPAVAVGMWRFANDYVNTHFKKPDKERAKRNHVRAASVRCSGNSVRRWLRNWELEQPCWHWQVPAVITIESSIKCK